MSQASHELQLRSVLCRWLGRSASRSFLWQMTRVAHEMDVNKGGYADARGGCVNFWCGPEDQPEAYRGVAITQGCLEYPRSFVGTLGWEWDINSPTDVDGAPGVDLSHFFLEAIPYDLLRARGGENASYLSDEQKKALLSDEESDGLFAWMEKKALELITLTEHGVGE